MENHINGTKKVLLQPFRIIRGIKSNKFDAIFTSCSSNLDLPSRERFSTFVEYDPWDILINFKCDCNGFKFRNGNMCKHIKHLIETLKLWGEISEQEE